MSKRKGPHHNSMSARSNLLQFFLILIAGAVLLPVFVFQAYQIPSASMENTLLVGDFVIGNKLAFGARLPLMNFRLPGYQSPRNGEIIIFKFPHDREREFIKRCLALPGQTVEIKNKVLYVDGERTIDPERSKCVDPRVLPKESANGVRDNYGRSPSPPITIS